MQKPVYYLWKSQEMPEEDFKNKQKYYEDLGYLVISFLDGKPKQEIHGSLQQVIKNHYE